MCICHLACDASKETRRLPKQAAGKLYLGFAEAMLRK
jgi:hypothetical protein